METISYPMPYSEPSLADAFPVGKRKLEIGVDSKDQNGDLLAPASPASTAVPTSPLGNTGPLSPKSWPLLSGDWAQQLDGLHHDLAAARLDLQHAAGQPEHAQLVNRIVSLETDVKVLRGEAEDWRHRCLELERDRAIAAVREDKVQLELREAQERERNLASHSLELQLSKADAQNMLESSEVEVCALRERMQIQEAEQDAMLRSSKKQEDLMKATGTQLSVLHAEASALREQLKNKEVEHAATSKKHDDALQTAGKELTILLAESSGLRAKIDAQDAERAAMLRVSKKQDETLQTMGVDLASVNDQLRNALAREVRGDALRDELSEQCASYAEALQHAQARSANLEAALAASMKKQRHEADELSESQKSNMSLQSKVKSLEAALSASDAKRAQLAREAEILRSRGDHQELVSQTLRLDLQDALSKKGLGDIAPPLCQGIGEDAYRSRKEIPPLPCRPLSASRVGHKGTPSLRQEGVGSLSARSGARRDYPRSTHSTKLRAEVLSARTPDRTAAADRYDAKGHLVSFDALGRAVQ